MIDFFLTLDRRTWRASLSLSEAKKLVPVMKEIIRIKKLPNPPGPGFIPNLGLILADQCCKLIAPALKRHHPEVTAESLAEMLDLASIDRATITVWDSITELANVTQEPSFPGRDG